MGSIPFTNARVNTTGMLGLGAALLAGSGSPLLILLTKCTDAMASMRPRIPLGSGAGFLAVAFGPFSLCTSLSPFP